MERPHLKACFQCLKRFLKSMNVHRCQNWRTLIIISRFQILSWKVVTGAAQLWYLQYLIRTSITSSPLLLTTWLGAGGCSYLTLPRYNKVITSIATHSPSTILHFWLDGVTCWQKWQGSRMYLMTTSEASTNVQWVSQFDIETISWLLNELS